MSGLLVLTLPYYKLSAHLPQVIRGATSHVAGILYVHLDISIRGTPPHSLPPLSWSSSTVRTIYSKFFNLSPNLDVRVLMNGFKGQSYVPTGFHTPVNLVMVDYFETDEIKLIKSKYCQFCSESNPFMLLNTSEIYNNLHADKLSSTSYDECESKVYKSIVAGGTFDRIHLGHKLLLSEALLHCSKKFTIGIAEGPLLAKKSLPELIESTDVRITNLTNLLQELDPSVEYVLEPIQDPLGPSGKDPDMEMIIVSKETLKGGNYVNSIRAERNLNVLDVKIIDLIDDTHRREDEENKISSSSGRMRLLGTLLKKPISSVTLQKYPYVIGLTGGSASGKSSIAKRLAALGAEVIDCDKLGHLAYVKGTASYYKLLDMYGKKILATDGQIDRKALGKEVFSCPEKLEALNKLVWPEIVRLINERIDEVRRESSHIVVVLDAAVLLEGGWDKLCHEVWVCLLPRDEAVRRIADRDGCTADQAQQRLSKQLTDAERLQRANVAFCSLWSYDCTARQVLTAWKRLQQQLSSATTSL